MTRILLADDHNIFRQGLKEIVDNTTDLFVVSEAATGEETLSLCTREAVDIVLLDLTLPDIHGLDVLKHLRQACPETSVIILSMHPESQYGLRALRAGASGYLSKDCEADTLIAAIRKVRSGRLYVSPALSELIAGGAFGRKGVTPQELLSDREFQILGMIAAGKRIKDIADALGLSPKTVSTYRHRLLEKLNLETNEELCTYARNNDMLG
jgi:DNA-binding NarL/FixJ family response regulator